MGTTNLMGHPAGQWSLDPYRLNRPPVVLGESWLDYEYKLGIIQPSNLHSIDISIVLVDKLFIVTIFIWYVLIVYACIRSTESRASYMVTRKSTGVALLPQGTHRYTIQYYATYMYSYLLEYKTQNARVYV